MLPIVIEPAEGLDEILKADRARGDKATVAFVIRRSDVRVGFEATQRNNDRRARPRTPTEARVLRCR